jgi:hypothetical protein
LRPRWPPPSGEDEWCSAQVKELPTGLLVEQTSYNIGEIVAYGKTREEAMFYLNELITQHYAIKRKLASEGRLQPIDLEAFDVEHGLKEKMTFSAQILYNVGLGPEFFDIPHIEAINVDEAKVEAKKIANKEFGDGNWMEVKVKPIS